MTDTRYYSNRTQNSSAPSGNVLCARLKNRFNARVDAITMKPVTTSQLVRTEQERGRANMADEYLNPFVTQPQNRQASQNQTPQNQIRQNPASYRSGPNTAARPAANRPANNVRQTVRPAQTTRSGYGESYNRIYGQAQHIRERNGFIAGGMQQNAGMSYNRRPNQAGQTNVNKPRQTNVSSQNTGLRTYKPSEDVRRQTNPLVRFLDYFDIDVTGRKKAAAAANTAEAAHNGSFAATLKRNFAGISLYAVCIIMAIMVIYSFVVINNYSMDVSDLESSIAELTEKESDLTLQLEQKDDIRVIEKIATENIGMVKSELVEKRFVTLTGDETIQLLSNESGSGDSGSEKLTFLSIFDRIAGSIGDYLK